jgi:hypothetical protein
MVTPNYVYATIGSHIDFAPSASLSTKTSQYALEQSGRLRKEYG